MLPLASIDARRAAPTRKVAKARPKPSASEKCEPRKFRIILDVGHSSESQGATSARNDVEFGFNLQLARLIGETLKSAGFDATRLLVTEGKARASLLKRVGTANAAHADFFLSI